jgi:quinol monooxygenase YgiN
VDIILGANQMSCLWIEGKGEAMEARVSRGQVRPGKMDEFVTMTKETVRQVYRKQKGCRGFLLLTDRSQNRAVAISLWETVQDRMAHEASDPYKNRMAEVAPLGDGRPTVEYLDAAIVETF